MAPPGDQSLIEVLAEPLRDANFRSLLGFLAAWNFAANVAVPFFSVYMLVRLGLPVSWVLDFLFLASVVLGLYALHRLLAVREEGVVEDDVMATEFNDEVRKAVRHVGNVGGMRLLTSFPYALLRHRRGPRSDEVDGS